jgi:hypothetical protein
LLYLKLLLDFIEPKITVWELVEIGQKL